MTQLMYVQDSGKLYAGTQLLGICYAGRGVGLNNPAMGASIAVGPLPAGNYLLSVEQTGTKLGPYVFALVPSPANNMHGRSAFYLHWDNALRNFSASEGCIVAPAAVMAQIRGVSHQATYTVEQLGDMIDLAELRAVDVVIGEGPRLQ